MEYWKATDDVHKTVRELIGQNHPDLAVISDEIVVVFREKASKSGGRVNYGTARKASSLSNALAGENYKFVLEVAADTWEHDLTSKQREALLDSLLCACRADADDKSGDVKLSIARPDVTVFRENIERYGMWIPKEETSEEEQEPGKDASAVVDELIKGA